MKNINVIVVGSTGYIGLELIKILAKHPYVNIKYLCSQKSIGKKISYFDNKLKSFKKLPKLTNIKKVNFTDINVVFTALPNGEAQKISKKLNKKILLIDLSADFRLNSPKSFKKWYNFKHKAKNLIKQSIYSLPELVNKDISKYKIIACPGCYPTSIQLPLVPLLKSKLIKKNNIIVDSKSGYSGAGKGLHKKFKHKNIYESLSAYGVSGHRHLSELNEQLFKINKKEIPIIFIPHLSPMFRGILSTIYVDLEKGVTIQMLHKYLKNYYKKNHFIRIKKVNKNIGTSEVMNTNYCDISLCFNNKKVIIFSAIDNLIKGGSGQAVQNFNKFYNFRETLGF